MSLLVARGTADQEKRVRQLLCEAGPRSFSPLKRLAVNWQLRYNAACFYSRLAKGAPAAEREAHLETANMLLKQVLSDPAHQITGGWLLEDPDLELARQWAGGDWKHVNVIEKVTKPQAVTTKAAKPVVVAARRAATALKPKRSAKSPRARKPAKARVPGKAKKP